MGEPSRREFLRSSAAAAAAISSSFFAEETLFANSAKSLAIRKGLVYSMLPETLSHVDRCKLAKDTGFEVVQAPTTSDERIAQEMKAAAEKAGILIDSVMNMDIGTTHCRPAIRQSWRRAFRECVLLCTMQNSGAPM
jgi:L-ribulose-5-phosphate 3-epimerase